MVQLINCLEWIEFIGNFDLMQGLCGKGFQVNIEKKLRDINRFRDVYHKRNILRRNTMFKRSVFIFAVIGGIILGLSSCDVSGTSPGTTYELEGEWIIDTTCINGTDLGDGNFRLFYQGVMPGVGEKTYAYAAEATINNIKYLIILRYTPSILTNNVTFNLYDEGDMPGTAVAYNIFRGTYSSGSITSGQYIGYGLYLNNSGTFTADK